MSKNIEVGDLIVIQDLNKFDDSVRSFRGKWLSVSPTAAAMATGAVKAAGTATEMVKAWASAAVTEKETDKQIKLEYYGYAWKDFNQIFGIVTDITPEEHPDFDVLKIREQDGGVRYCRRYIVEMAQDKQ